jgi:ribosome-binding factor A
MKRKRVSQEELQSLCGEVHADDGVDPTEFFRKSRSKNGSRRKTQQLCHQVAETLSLVLGGELDEALRDVRIVGVRPGADAAQLLVLVTAADASGEVDPTAVVAALAAASGRLRAEVAAAITRRRAPKLIFQFIERQDAREELP